VAVPPQLAEWDGEQGEGDRYRQRPEADMDFEGGPGRMVMFRSPSFAANLSGCPVRPASKNVLDFWQADSNCTAECDNFRKRSGQGRGGLRNHLSEPEMVRGTRDRWQPAQVFL
jgi:hypothetical protein